MSLLRPTGCNAVPAINYENYRYLNKEKTSNERGLMTTYWDELIGRFGTRIEYYTYNYSISTHDYLYGEEPVASFSGPLPIVMMADLQTESILLSKFGIDTNADCTLVVTMENYARIFGRDVEPKSGDVLRLVELGWDVNEVPGYGSATSPTSAQVLNTICMYKGVDPATIVYPPTANREGTPVSGSDVWVRCPQLYEITERRHQDMTLGTNTLMGHYIWVLKCKRFDYSYQPGINPECRSDDIGEETRTGLLSGGSQSQSPDKTYPGNATDDSNAIWDYNDPDHSRPISVYGDY